jgi:hypothetical protein
VAADVQQDNIAGGHLLQRGAHGLRIHSLRGGVIIRIVPGRQAGRAEHTFVIAPGRIRHPNRSAGAEILEQLGADAQGSGAAGGLGHGHAVGGNAVEVAAEHQMSHRLAVFRGAVDRRVSLGFLAFPQQPFGTLDALQHRCLALVVDKDPHAQINLRGARVLAKGLGQAENGIGGSRFDLVEEHVSLLGLGVGGLGFQFQG